MTDTGPEARSWAGLVAGAGGLALGGLALARSRNNQPAPVRVPGSGSTPGSAPRK